MTGDFQILCLSPTPWRLMRATAWVKMMASRFQPRPGGVPRGTGLCSVPAPRERLSPAAAHFLAAPSSRCWFSLTLSPPRYQHRPFRFPRCCVAKQPCGSRPFPPPPPRPAPRPRPGQGRHGTGRHPGARLPGLRWPVGCDEASERERVWGRVLGLFRVPASLQTHR